MQLSMQLESHNTSYSTDGQVTKRLKLKEGTFFYDKTEEKETEGLKEKGMVVEGKSGGGQGEKR